MSRREGSQVTPPRVVILQEYVPNYRSRMFTELRDIGIERGVEIVVAAGAPRRSQHSRGDASTDLSITRVKQKEINVFGQRLTFRQVSHLYRDADLVIAEQARRNVDLYVRLARRRGHVALWGHGADSVEAKSRASRSLLGWLTKRATWFFAYTERGAAYVESLGFERSRITVLHNSTDTRGLRRARGAVSQAEVDELRSVHQLTEYTSIFIGALDESKRLPFLLESVKLIRSKLPGFKLLVVGEGPNRNMLNAAVADGAVIHFPHASGHDLARIAACAKLICMPGRVGLVAVDSFALGLPLVTTDWPFHAPERDYLDDDTSVITEDSPVAFANAVTALFADPERLTEMGQKCVARSDEYSAEAMARRFIDGIEAALKLSAKARHRRATRKGNETR